MPNARRQVGLKPTHGRYTKAAIAEKREWGSDASWRTEIAALRAHRTVAESVRPFMMMRTSSIVIGLGILLAAVAVGGVANADSSNCQMVRIDEWPVRLANNKLIIDGAINGQRVGILLDTGAMRTLIFRPAAVHLGLPLSPVFGAWMTGVGGDTRGESAEVKEIRIGTATRREWTMAVAGEQDFGDGVAVALGEDFFQNVDVEFDLAHRTVRLFKPAKCAGASLAYWAPNGAPTVPIDAVNRYRPRIIVPVRINGQPVEAILDSGASTTVLNKSVARRLGLRPDTPGVVAAGTAKGLGKNLPEVWIGPVESFAIGKETIRTTTIPFADLGDTAQMLLGADFLLAHRLLVAHSQGKIYFTYIGGPVFRPAEPAKPSADLPPDVGKGDANPAVALTLSGNEWKAKGDLDRAIADYDAAIRADPQYAAAFANRGLAKQDKGDIDAGIADLSRAIEINPKFPRAYLARGDARRRTGDAGAAIADYARAIEIDPKLAVAYNKLAWTLSTARQSTVRDGQRAVETALKACELSEWRNPSYIDTLAASYARAGNFSDAVKWQHKALESSRLANDDEPAQRLRLYEEGKPWPPD